MRAPKRQVTSVYNPHWECPDREWLEYHLNTLRKSAGTIADEVGANIKTVRKWIGILQVTYWGQKKVDPIPSGMTAPRRGRSVGGQVTWCPPSRGWLFNQHYVLERSLNEIAEDLGTSHDVVLKWCRQVGVERVRRYPSGPKHKNWKEVGHSRPRSHARIVLRRTGIQEVCTWCNSTGQLQVHHRDHNPENNDPQNLMWLCYYCHELETALWHLVKQNKIDLKCEGNTMVIMFKKGESNAIDGKI